MYKAFVFAGTAEGRRIAEYLSENKIRAKAYTATGYGRDLLKEGHYLDVSAKRLDERDMEEELKLLEPGGLVLDATHPYAKEVTENIRQACGRAGVRYLRVVRRQTGMEKGKGEKDLSGKYIPGSILTAEDVGEAAALLDETEGNVLITTGSKELAGFTRVKDWRERLYARVLSLPKVAAECADLGFQGKHLICMQGPFSAELNSAMIRQLDIRWLVTKEAGRAGGFPEKCQAAAECGCGLIVIGRPCQEEGPDLAGTLDYLAERFGIPKTPVQQVTLVGIGMGTRDTITVEGLRAVEEADLLIGAKRMLENLAKPGSHTFAAYRPKEIKNYILEHPECKKTAVLLSGDVGFYSGARKLLDVLGEDLRTEVICGVSSMICFCAKLRVPWEDVRPVSLHGRECNLTGMLREYPRIFAITGSADGAARVCRKLVSCGMEQVKVSVGQRLTYEDEKIWQGTAAELTELETDPLSVMLLENPRAKDHIVTHGIPDGEFIRAKVPMTKEEVRSVSLSKLRLTKNAVVYDIGAGTGSVSVEMARMASEGVVYAIERKEEAAALIEENKRKFACDNLTVIRGLAPECLKDLERPTHAFIGGSAGNMKEILETLLGKNPHIRIVMNAIALETTGEMLRLVKELDLADVDIVTVSAARAKELGNYHLMMGQNPVTIVSATGRNRTVDRL